MSESDEKKRVEDKIALPADDDPGLWQEVLYLHLARSYRDKGELDKAALYYEKALNSMPDSRAVSFEYSRVLKEIGRAASKEESCRVEDLRSLLQRQYWGSKEQLYSEVFEFAELQDEQSAIDISVVVVSISAGPPPLDCLR